MTATLVKASNVWYMDGSNIKEGTGARVYHVQIGLENGIKLHC
jgi:hypothetical protein